MKGSGLAYFLLTAPNARRVRFANHLRGTASGRALRVVYRACAPIWANALMSSLTGAIQPRLYRTEPRSYWQREDGRRYLKDEAFLLGSGSMSKMRRRFLADEIRTLGATSVGEVGSGYGRLLRKIRKNIIGGRVWGSTAHDNEGHYETLGYRRVKATPYPLNPPGQNLTFQVFKKCESGDGA